MDDPYQGRKAFIPYYTDKLLAFTILPFISRTVTPNAVTVFRFATIPFVFYFLWTQQYLTGFVIFVISALSDAVDGAMARTRMQITDWGKIYDPLADKLLMAATAVVIISRFGSLWILLLIISLDLIDMLGALFQLRKGNILSARMPGKIKLILQAVGLGFLLLYAMVGSSILLTLGVSILYLAIFFAIFSLLLHAMA